MSGPSAAPVPPSPRAKSPWWPGALVGLLAMAWFGFDLASESPFVDESAYLSQTYFADLWLNGDVNNPAWLDLPAYDLPPLPKYLFGVALRAVGHRRPGPSAAQAWYHNTKKTFVTPAAHVAARWPSVVLGALGCVAVFGLGVLAAERRVGLLAAFFLIINPLYRTHARRTMSDVPCEALMLLALLVALWTWREMLSGRSGPTRWLAAGLAGVFGGLAVLSKLTGGLAMIVLAGWVVLAMALPGVRARRKVAVVSAAIATGLVAFALFVAMNPYLTARPRVPLDAERQAIARMGFWERLEWLVRYRRLSSSSQQVGFAHNALLTPEAKVKAVAVQGFGRFGPFGPRDDDSTRRFDWAQDRGALIWWPCVALGVAWAWARGRRQRTAGEPPTAWAILVEAALACAVVTAILPMAWDRYYLSIQPAAALLASGGLVAAFDGLAWAPSARPEAGGGSPCA